MAKVGREATKQRGRAPKIAQVGVMTKALQSGHGFLLLNNKGLTYAQATALRAKLRENRVVLKVIKNTLLRRAIENAGVDPEPLKELLKRETVVAIGLDDPVTPAKVLSEFIGQKENEGKLEFKGGYLDGKVLSAADVESLAKLPGRDELLGMMLGSMMAPAQNLVYALNQAVGKVVYAVDAHRRKLEEQSAA